MMTRNPDEETFMRALVIGMGAAQSVLHREGRAALDRYVQEWNDKVNERWSHGPRKMVAGDIFILIPMMTAADLGLAPPEHP